MAHISRLTGAGLALLLAALTLTACSKDSEELLEETVREYNTAIIQSYRDTDISYLKPFATKDQMHRLVQVVVDLKDRKERLMLNLDELRIEAVTLENDKATVKTYEKWTFWRVSVESQEALTEKETDEYFILYTLVKEDGKWKVNALDKG